MLKFLLYLLFLTPLCLLVNIWWLIRSLIFLVSFMFRFHFPYFSCWGGLGYIFGCDVISYGLVLLRFWICVLIILAREGINRSAYCSNVFIFVVIILMVMLDCAFRRVRLFSIYFLRVELFLHYFLSWGGDINLSVFRLIPIYYFILWWLLYLCLLGLYRFMMCVVLYILYSLA